MSIERIQRKRGVGWRVRWREGGRNRARILDRKTDALAFEAEIRRRSRAGDLAALDAGQETLQEFAEEWWQLYAEPNLAATTLASLRVSGMHTSCLGSAPCACVTSTHKRSPGSEPS